MNSLRKVDSNVKYICLTAYKALLLLKYLIVRPLNKQEIFEIFKNDEFITQPLSSENLRVMINSLKELGCKISRPNPKNDYKYELLENPFSLSLTKDEINLIRKFRKKPLGKKDWHDVLNINSLIDKINLAINDKNIKEHLENQKLLPEVDKKLIIDVQKCCENKSTVIFEYLSGRKMSEFEMITSFLKYERDRLYVWGYSTKYKDFSYLRMDKIKSLKVLDKSSEKIYNNYCIRYEMFNKNYNPEENEIIIEEKENSLIIDCNIESKFYAIQKFLEMGCDCKIISPEPFKQEFLSTLKSLKEVYSDDEK